MKILCTIILIFLITNKLFCQIPLSFYDIYDTDSIIGNLDREFVVKNNIRMFEIIETDSTGKYLSSIRQIYNFTGQILDISEYRLRIFSKEINFTDPLSSYKFNYNSEHKLTSIIKYYLNKKKKVINYDDFSKVSCIVDFGKKEKDSMLYKYDQDRRITEMKWYSSDNTIYSNEKWLYKNQNKIERIIYDSIGKPEDTIFYKIDNKENKISKNWVSKSTNVEHAYYVKYDEKENIVEEFNLQDGKKVNLYNSSNQLIKQRYFYKNKIDSSETIFEYDLHKNLSKEIITFWLNSNKKKEINVSVIKYNNKYNLNGDLIQSEIIENRPDRVKMIWGKLYKYYNN